MAKLSKREIQRAAERESVIRTVADGNHHHVAEIYGEGEARMLTRWARRRVLTQGLKAPASPKVTRA